MDRIKLLQNPLPIDRVAARVVFSKGDHWEPGICKSEPYWDTPPPIMNPPRVLYTLPWFKNPCGLTWGEMRCVGVAAQTSTGTGGSIHRLVARCSCGSYVLRKLNIMLKKPVEDCCPRCHAKRRLASGFYNKS